MSLAPSGLDLGTNPITGTPVRSTRGRNRRTFGDRDNLNPPTAFPSFPAGADPFQMFLADPGQFNFGLEFAGSNLQGLGERESFGRISPLASGPLAGTYGTLALPEGYAASNPAALQRFLQTLGPEATAPYLAALDAAATAEAKTLAGQQEGIGTLEQAISQVLARQGEFREDPNRAAIREGLQARAGPDYRAFSQAEEADVLNQLARTASTAASRRLFSSGGQGGPGTASTAAQATADAIAASQGVSAVATIDAINRAARDAALGDVSAFQAAEDQVEGFFTQVLTGIETQIASIQAGNEFVPMDPTAFMQLDRAILEAEDLGRRLDEAEATAVQSQEPDFWDLLTGVGSLSGLGLFG